MKILKIISAPYVLLLSACSLLSPHAEFIPDNTVLKEAIIGKPYLTKIDILGGGVIGSFDSGRYAGLVTPNDSGLLIRNCQLPEWKTKDMKPKDSNDYNCVEIYGTPTKEGVIKIDIGGGMYGNMFVPAGEFRKIYTIKVKAAE